MELERLVVWVAAMGSDVMCPLVREATAGTTRWMAVTLACHRAMLNPEPCTGESPERPTNCPAAGSREHGSGQQATSNPALQGRFLNPPEAIHSLPPPPFLLSLSVFSSREDLVGALHQLAIAAAKGRGGRCRSELSQTMDAVHDAVELDLAHNKKGARTQIVNAIATIKVRTGGVEGGGH